MSPYFGQMRALYATQDTVMAEEACALRDVLARVPCAVTGATAEVPVLASDGHVYDLDTLRQWCRAQQPHRTCDPPPTSPVTREYLRPSVIHLRGRHRISKLYHPSLTWRAARSIQVSLLTKSLPGGDDWGAALLRSTFPGSTRVFISVELAANGSAVSVCSAHALERGAAQLLKIFGLQGLGKTGCALFATRLWANDGPPLSAEGLVAQALRIGIVT